MGKIKINNRNQEIGYFLIPGLRSQGDQHTHITMNGIEVFVCEFMNVNSFDIRRRSRKREFVEARQLICYLTNELINTRKLGRFLSLKVIGAHVNVDHSTAIYGIGCVRDRMDVDVIFRKDVVKLIERILATVYYEKEAKIN